VRKNAAKLLGEIGDARAIMPLMDALSDANSESLRESIVEALVKIGKPEIEAMIAALGNEDYIQVYYAAEVLGRMVSVAVPYLIAALRDETNPYVRGCAAKALGEIGDVRAVKPLKELLNMEEDECVRESAMQALINIKI